MQRRFVNAILKEYFEIRRLDAESKTERVLQLLEDEKVERTAVIAQLKQEMRKLGKNVEGADPITGMPVTGDKANGPLAEIGEQWIKAEVDRKMLEMRIIALRETLSKKSTMVSESQVEMALSDTQEMRDLRAMIANKRSMLHRIESVVNGGREASAYKKLEREIESYERSLENAAKVSRPQIKEQLDTFCAVGKARTCCLSWRPNWTPRKRWKRCCVIVTTLSWRPPASRATSCLSWNSYDRNWSVKKRSLT